jgi:hypothetical protein
MESLSRFSVTRHEHFSTAATAAPERDGRGDFRSVRAMKPAVENAADPGSVPLPASRGALVLAGSSLSSREVFLLRRTHIT